MSREIIEFVQELERDKGIESDTLVEALEDALLAAYKKTPGASRHAVVELDREEGDFRVFSIELPLLGVYAFHRSSLRSSLRAGA